MKNFIVIGLLAIAGLVTYTGCKKKKNDPAVPTVTTIAVTNATDTTGLTGGNVTSDGGGTITARGVCWDTTAAPTVALSTKTNDGGGTGSFVSSLKGLLPGKTYYVRAFATNSAGTGYGSAHTFKTTTITVAAYPNVSTVSVTGITFTSANCGGNVTNDGGFAVVARGVCWSTSPDPTIGMSTNTINGSGKGTFTSNITGLTPGTKYYVRAYATNSAGVAYGEERTFTTPTLILATVTTTAVGSITLITANSGGNITNDGGYPVTARGVCWSTSPDPTIDLSTKTSTGTGTGGYGALMTSLTPGTIYFVRAYATNAAGTAYGANVTFSTTPLTVGMSYGGGKVAYILNSTNPGYNSAMQHGLIVANADLPETSWGCEGTFVSTSPDFGTGAANTTAMSTACGAGKAGRVCADYVSGGFSDWYLPSRDEMKKVYDNRAAIGGLSTTASGFYWTSTQTFDNNYSTIIKATDGTAPSWGKSSYANVRPIRSF